MDGLTLGLSLLLCLSLSLALLQTQALYSQSSYVMNKVTTSVQCEISSFPIMENSDNTNFRCPSITEARLSVAECSLGPLGAAIFHTHNQVFIKGHLGTLTPSQLEQRLNTVWLCVFC